MGKMKEEFMQMQQEELAQQNPSINQLNNQLRKIKYDVLNIENTNYKSKTFYHNWIKHKRKLYYLIENSRKKRV